MMRKPTWVALAGLVAVAVTACSTGTPAPSPQAASARPTASLPPVEVETGVVHVHGLGVDPADGALYAATHSGLFRLPERGQAERIANRAQDTMGFSVVGPNRFIGSGHPDFREDDVRPPLLGLIESRDAGVTWERVSLHGEADFHALAARHGQVYGYDATSGTFMVSADNRQWDRRSQLDLFAFAVDPASPERVVATTPRGPVVSTDGGRSWGPLTGGPALAVVAWMPRAGLYGVTGDGAVHRSTDGGQSWTRSGSVGGAPEALTVDERDDRTTIYVAVAKRGVLASSDDGKTFTVRYTEDPS